MGNKESMNPYQNLEPEAKENINKLFEDILKRISVDFNHTEFKDIKDSVKEMLWKVANRINESSVFKIFSIFPCGSMAEETSVWKIDKESGEPYLEFDFLAVLDKGKDDCFRLKTESKGAEQLTCTRCTELKKTRPEFVQALTDSYGSLYPGIPIESPGIVHELFLKQLTSHLAPCCLDVDYSSESRDIAFMPKTNQEGNKCEVCTIDKPTGNSEYQLVDEYSA